MYASETVKRILETAIDSLVDNFAREPYIHRCEHSIHCELYNMLGVHRALQGLYPLREGEKHKTTLIHKEWPETTPRPVKKGRRGNFDLVILDPKEIQNRSVEDFTDGRIRPAFVVEMGLNYGLDHLINDDQKLANSECKNGYLVHLWQPHKGITDANLTNLKDFLKGNYRVAAVVFVKGVPMIKHLSDHNLVLTCFGE